MDKAWALKRMETAVSDPHSRLHQRDSTGKPVVGYFCSYVPEEIIHASGATAVRLLQGCRPGRGADRYMQNFCCSYARSLLEDILTGNHGYLKGIVMPHTCDTMRNLADIVESAGTGIKVFPLLVPTATETSAAFNFAESGFHNLKAGLEELFSVKISSENLVDSIDLYNRCRRRLFNLWQRGLSNYEAYIVYLAAQLMDKEEFLELSGDISGNNCSDDRFKVALYGGPLPEASLLSILDAHDIAVVWDSLCTASRYGGGEAIAVAGSDPMSALVKHYLQKMPCPTKLDLHGRREAELIQGVKDNGAEAVLFIVQQFCEFHAFDYPAFKARLEQEVVPSLKLSLEYPYGLTGQDMTRLQAFQEMVAGKGVD